jgi:hypothetical protein
MNNTSLSDPSEHYKRKLILTFLIKDVAEIVLSYMDKHNFECINQIHDNESLLYTDGTDVYRCKQYVVIINDSKKYCLTEHGKIVGVIDKNIILLYDIYTRQYKIHNIITSQTNIIHFDVYIEFVCTNDKYIVFCNKNNPKELHIFSITDQKFINKINIDYMQIQIIKSILYTLSSSGKMIYKYTIRGENIGAIFFKCIFDEFKILSNEIILIRRSFMNRGDYNGEIIFCDLEGRQLARTITQIPFYNYAITKSHLYIEHDNIIHGYKRTL